MQDVVERTQKVIDLKAQIAEVAGESPSEIIFIENSPRRNKVTIYSMRNGEPVQIPEYMINAALSKVEDGKPMFTGDKSKAPEWVPGSIKCFLHAESIERTSGLLAAVGLEAKVCVAGGLASQWSKGQHARGRHSKEWAAMEQHTADVKEQAAVDRAERQLEATLALARQASGVAEAPVKAEVLTCQSCARRIEGKLKDHHCEESK